MHTKRWSGVVALVLLVAAWTHADAAQATIELAGSGTTRTVACDNQNVTMGGSRNTIVLTGTCPRLDITGSNNTVIVEAVGRVEITGLSNIVRWQHSLVGDRPAVSLTGLGNSVVQDLAPAPVPDPAPPAVVPEPEPAPEPEPEPAPPAIGVITIATLLESNVERTLECGEGVVILVGSSNRLTLTGLCQSVTVLGTANQVWVQQARTIEVTGDANTVTWETPVDDQEPTLAIIGTDSIVTQAVSP